MATIKSVVDLLTKYINLLHGKNIHTEGDQTITGDKTFTEKLFLTPKEDDEWAETYIYGTENTAKLKIQNRIEPEDWIETGELPARSSLTLETNDNTGQGRFTLLAQSKMSSTGDGYKQWQLLGTSDGLLSWTGRGNSLGHIEIVDSSSLSGSKGYIRYSSGLQICYGHVNCANYGYKSKYSQFTWPAAFKDTAYQVTLCPNTSSMDVVANIKTGRTTTYCNIGVRNLSQTSSNWNVDVLIHAIGYWK